MSRRSSATAGILERIVAAKRDEIERLAPHRAELRRAAEAAAPARPFAAALARPDTISVIAEFKRRSPSAGSLAAGDATAGDVANAARTYAAAGAAAMSVLTDGPFFGGGLDDLRAARAACGLPVLRKDFVTDALQIWEARAAGADAVLLIVRILDDVRLREFVALAVELSLAALVEVHDATELARALAAGATLIGLNNRNLATFETDLAISLQLARQVPGDRVVVAESGIGSSDDVARLAAAGVDAVLVGESLMRADDNGVLLGELAGLRRSGGNAARARPGRSVRVKICGVCRPEDAAAAAAAGADYIGVILSSGHTRTRSLAEAESIYEAAPGVRRVGVFVDDHVATVVAAAEQLGLDVVQLHGAESADDVRAIARAATRLQNPLRPAGGGWEAGTWRNAASLAGVTTAAAPASASAGGRATEPPRTAPPRSGAGKTWRVWKAIRARDGVELESAIDRYGAYADGILLDGWSARGAGGVGALFPWELAARVRNAMPDEIDLVAAGGLRAENVKELVQRLGPDVVDVSSGVEEAVGRKSEAKIRAFVEAISP